MLLQFCAERLSERIYAGVIRNKDLPAADLTGMHPTEEMHAALDALATRASATSEEAAHGLAYNWMHQALGSVYTLLDDMQTSCWTRVVSDADAPQAE